MAILVAVLQWYTWTNRAHVLPFPRPSCYFKTRPPSCVLGTSFYTVLKGCDLMTYVSDNYTSYSAPSLKQQMWLCCFNIVNCYLKPIFYSVDADPPNFTDDCVRWILKTFETRNWHKMPQKELFEVSDLVKEVFWCLDQVKICLQENGISIVEFLDFLKYIFEDNSIITQSAQLMTFHRQVSYLIPGNLHMPVGIQLDARLRQELMVQCNTIWLQITVQTRISKCTSNFTIFFEIAWQPWNKLEEQKLGLFKITFNYH